MKKEIKKILAVLLALSLFAGVFAGCGSSTASKDTSTDDKASTDTSTDTSTDASDDAQDTDTADEVDFYAESNTIRLSSPAGQVRTAVNILAKELGFYDEEGVNVELVNVTGTDALAAISSGSNDIDVLGTGIVPDLVFAAQGSDIVVFAGTATEGSSVISKADEVDNYKDLTQYGGLTISTTRNSTSYLTMRGILKELGVDVDSLTIIELDSNVDVAQAVVKGEADLGFLPTEYAQTTRDLGVEIVYEIGEIKPDYVCCRQVTSAARLEEKFDAFVKFEIANIRSLEYYQAEENRDTVISTLAKQSGQTEDYINEYLFINRTKLDQNPNEEGTIDLYEYMKQAGVIDEDADPIENHIDLSVYEAALSELLSREPDNEFYQQLLTAYREQNPSSTL
jgi:NitT/TauT family transport system substrate-binding protein